LLEWGEGAREDGRGGTSKILFGESNSIKWPGIVHVVYNMDPAFFANL
jgi:hypothetical protein